MQNQTQNQMPDLEYMKRAIALAKKGAGAVNPNPLVGAVIVKDGKIIGEGYHRKYGGLHAERDAFAHLTEDANGAEMYVTLEPCCHYGKQPPCVDAIIEHGIKRVYVGSDDPNVMVSGGGYARLKEAGIEVVTHVMKEECDSINAVFFHYITKKTPYVVMKYAMTMDGKTSTRTGASKWITGSAARGNVMVWRNLLTGIMVGSGTVLADDPMLNCRALEFGITGLPERNPIRIICDSRLQIPVCSRVVQTAGEVQTIVATLNADYLAKLGFSQEEILKHQSKKTLLETMGVEIVETTAMDGHVNLCELMQVLGGRGIDGILLEGGGSLNASALQQGIVNEVHVYVAPKVFGGRTSGTPVSGEGVALPDEAFRFKFADISVFGEDIMLRYVKDI